MRNIVNMFRKSESVRGFGAHPPRPNHAEGVYIINSVGIVYHQHEVLYIIKPQEDTRWRVMRYSPKGADDIHDYVVMICQACGLDKKRSNFW